MTAGIPGTAAALPRRPGPTTRTRVVEYVADGEAAGVRRHEDRMAVEEPLEIRVASPGGPSERVAVTMRTPGHDFELAAGWLVHERLVEPSDIRAVRYCTDVTLRRDQELNVVTVEAERTAPLPAARVIGSACGVCGADSVAQVHGPPAPDVRLAPEVVHGLPDALREHQRVFSRTGAVHAAGLADSGGRVVVVREDVGRHNAVDKAVGSRILQGDAVPPVLVLSGRIGFELVQKAVVSGVGVLVAVGAPTSLAVDVAREHGLTLVGFTRPGRFVVFTGDQRIG